MVEHLTFMAGPMAAEERIMGKVLSRIPITMMIWNFLNMEQPCHVPVRVFGQKEDLYLRLVTLQINRSALSEMTVELYNGVHTLHPQTHSGITTLFEELVAEAGAFEHILKEQEEAYPAKHVSHLHVNLGNSDKRTYLATERFVDLMKALKAHSEGGFWSSPEVTQRTMILEEGVRKEESATWLTFGDHLARNHYGRMYRKSP